MGKSATDENVFRVLEPFSFDHDGRTYVMRRGDIVAGDNPAYAGREALFEEVSADVAREHALTRTQVSAVEVATAEPGQRRRMEIDSSVPEDAVTASVPPGPSTPAPTGEPPAPTPPPAPPTPAPTGPQTGRKGR